MSEEMKFFIYLLEQYAYYKHNSAGNILRKWEQYGITQKIYDNHWEYHTEAIENAFAEIDSLLATSEYA